MVSMPGTEGESTTSSTNSVVDAYWISMSCRPACSVMRLVVCRTFSSGDFLSPGNMKDGLTESPCCCTRYFASAPSPCWYITTAMSTTRTMCLCLEASSWSLDWPECTSAAKSAKLLARPLPNPSKETLWSVRSFIMLALLNSTSEIFVSSSFGARSKGLYKSTAWLSCHHLYDIVRMPMSSATTKDKESCCKLVSLSKAWAVLPPALFFKRLTSSARRCCTPALAPFSFTSGMNASVCSSGASAVTRSPKNLSAAAVAALKRLSSLRSRMLLISAVPSGGHLFGIESSLLLTSVSPLKGNLPDTKPYMTTPTAHTSTLRP
mmetsp:Transcript_93969/g.287529  ORF Transcript_93969/g.287529 Transcript_93969/m.287529 type:complete len:321 (+) Transcript_93969:785-1747(+)